MESNDRPSVIMILAAQARKKLRLSIRQQLRKSTLCKPVSTSDYDRDYDTNRQQAHGVRAREEYQSSRAGREVVNQSITEGMKQNRVGLDPPGS